MKQWARKQTGFTIVELLIVVVVIAILATITIVAYNGIRERAKVSAVQSALAQANKKVLAYAALNSDTYPDSLAQAGVTDTSIYYQYSVDNGSVPRRYAITGSDQPAGSTTFYVTSTQTIPSTGTAPGQNLIVWNKPQESSAPIPLSAGVTIDTSVFRTSTASIRIAPSSVGKALRNSPISGVDGQTITASAWIMTDSTWNGTGSNSKFRFGATSGGSLLLACGYSGIKTAWTYVSCSYTLNASNTSVSLTVGNDGTVGNIWLDDIVVSIE